MRMIARSTTTITKARATAITKHVILHGPLRRASIARVSPLGKLVLLLLLMWVLAILALLPLLLTTLLKLVVLAVLLILWRCTISTTAGTATALAVSVPSPIVAKLSAREVGEDVHYRVAGDHFLLVEYGELESWFDSWC